MIPVVEKVYSSLQEHYGAELAMKYYNNMHAVALSNDGNLVHTKKLSYLERG